MWSRNFVRRIVFSSTNSSIRSSDLRSLISIPSRPFCSIPGTPDSVTETFISPPPPPPPPQGHVYGRLTGICKHTLKTDVIDLFNESGLTLNDVKFVYNRSYNPAGVLIQFQSGGAMGAAQRSITRKGRLYRLEQADRREWNLLRFYDGKVVLLEGLPRTFQLDDVERFLSGLRFHASGMQLTNRMVLVECPTRLDAMTIFRMKNRSFCLNSPVSIRVLQ